MSTELTLFLQFGLPFAIIMVAYLAGSWLERKHFASIIAREDDLHGFPLLTFEDLPPDWSVRSSELVSGSIVVSLDYFKRIIAGLRALVGGRVKTYEPLLERARREAVLRMADEARALGYHAVINVRLETSRLANATTEGNGTAGVEMLAFGTAVRLR